MKALVLASLSCVVLAGTVHGQEMLSLTRMPSGAAPSLNLADNEERKKLGAMPPSLGHSPLQLVYEPKNKGTMAQWQSTYTTAAGQSFQYRAFVSESGSIHFVISSRF